MYDIHSNLETHYSILGIEKNASFEQIKKAYRKLSLECHPDRNGGDKIKTELYKKITEAYKILADKATDEVLGIHIIGARAADLIAQAVTAMEYSASAEDIARMSPAPPTYAAAMKEAALATPNSTA